MIRSIDSATAPALKSASQPLIAKLRIFGALTADEEDLLRDLCDDVRTVAARQVIIEDRERPEYLHFVVEGWAARYKLLPDGSRQIVGFLIPGDFCDLHVTILGKMDHGIAAVTQCRVAYVASKKIDALTEGQNGLTKALWWATLVDEAVLRNWVVNIGRRKAYERVAHLLCEMHARMKMVGLVDNDHLELPLTQEEIADATGLTPVHVNRTVQRLRRAGLIALRGRTLTVPDVPALEKAAGFEPSYLHIRRRVASQG